MILDLIEKAVRVAQQKSNFCKREILRSSTSWGKENEGSNFFGGVCVGWGWRRLQEPAREHRGKPDRGTGLDSAAYPGLIASLPRAFLSGFTVISHHRQRRDGARGGGVQLGASSHNLCLTNLPPEGLWGATPAPASPHPSSTPSAPGTGRGMAARGGGRGERD